MSTLLTILLSTHVYAALLTSIFFYTLLLDVTNRHPVSNRAMLWKSVAALFASIVVWVTGDNLSGYFLGREGFRTSPEITTLISKYVLTQRILFPLIVAVGFFMLLIIWRREKLFRSEGLAHLVLVTLGSIGFVIGSILMFLGVLTP